MEDYIKRVIHNANHLNVDEEEKQTALSYCCLTQDEIDSMTDGEIEDYLYVLLM